MSPTNCAPLLNIISDKKSVYFLNPIYGNNYLFAVQESYKLNEQREFLKISIRIGEGGGNSFDFKSRLKMSWTFHRKKFF